jgi:hypothetical protein
LRQAAPTEAFGRGRHPREEGDAVTKLRKCADWKAEPINETLFAQLTAAVSGKVGAERVRPALLVNAGGIEKVIDNAADARETLRRIAKSSARAVRKNRPGRVDYPYTG